MTVEKIAWIVGVQLGTMHESQSLWSKKIMGPDRMRRICRARNLVCLVLYESCGVSYNEIADLLNRRHESLIGRALAWSRKWILESAENAATWNRIQTSVKDTILAEQAHHAEVENIKVGMTK